MLFLASFNFWPILTEVWREKLSLCEVVYTCLVARQQCPLIHSTLTWTHNPLRGMSLEKNKRIAYTHAWLLPRMLKWVMMRKITRSLKYHVNKTGHSKKSTSNQNKIGSKLGQANGPPIVNWIRHPWEIRQKWIIRQNPSATNGFMLKNSCYTFLLHQFLAASVDVFRSENQLIWAFGCFYPCCHDRLQPDANSRMLRAWLSHSVAFKYYCMALS